MLSSFYLVFWHDIVYNTQRTRLNEIPADFRQKSPKNRQRAQNLHKTDCLMSKKCSNIKHYSRYGDHPPTLEVVGKVNCRLRQERAAWAVRIPSAVPKSRCPIRGTGILNWIKGIRKARKNFAFFSDYAMMNAKNTREVRS